MAIRGAGAGVTHGDGDGLSEFPLDLAGALTAGSTALSSTPASAIPAFSVLGSDASALLILAFFTPGSGASVLPMLDLVAAFMAAAAGRASREPADAAAIEHPRPAHQFGSCDGIPVAVTSRIGN